MDFHRACPHCGHVVTAYTVHLNRALAGAFVQFAEARIAAGGPLRKAELRLSHSQYGNFQKLCHFGLIEKRDLSRWEMTPLGWDFLRGRATILNPAGQFGNATLPAEHPAWSTHEDGRRPVSIRDVMPEEWKERAHYVAEKAGAA